MKNKLLLIFAHVRSLSYIFQCNLMPMLLFYYQLVIFFFSYLDLSYNVLFILNFCCLSMNFARIYGLNSMDMSLEDGQRYLWNKKCQ